MVSSIEESSRTSVILIWKGSCLSFVVLHPAVPARIQSNLRFLRSWLQQREQRSEPGALQGLCNVGWAGYKDTWQDRSVACVLPCTKQSRDKCKGSFKPSAEGHGNLLPAVKVNSPQVLHTIAADFQVNEGSLVHSPPSSVFHLLCPRNFLTTLEAFMQSMACSLRVLVDILGGFSIQPKSKQCPSLSSPEPIIFLLSKQGMPAPLWLLLPFLWTL